MQRLFRRATLAVLLADSILIGGVALAEEKSAGDHPSGGSKFFIAVGGYVTQLSGNVSASGSGAIGTTIDLGEVLGLDDGRNLARIDGYWRFKPRHRLDFTYYYLNRKGERSISRDFDYDGVHYEAGVQIDSEIQQQYLKLAYRFAFLNDDRIEVGLSAGLATFLYDVNLEGSGSIIVNGVPDPIPSFQRSTQTLVAPVPNIGLYGEFRIVPRLVLRQSFDYFGLSSGDWKARYAELRIDLDWRFTDHFGFGVGYDSTLLNYEQSANRSIDATSSTSGLVWYFTYSF